MYNIHLCVVFSAIIFCILISSEPIWKRLENNVWTFWINRMLQYLSGISLLIFDLSILTWGALSLWDWIH